MLHKLKKSLSDAVENLTDQAFELTDAIKGKASDLGDTIKGQASNLTDAAKEKAGSLIQAWVANIPVIETYGLTNIYFGVTMSLSPALELEFKGQKSDFTVERVEEILLDNKDNKVVTFIFTAIKNTLKMYEASGVVPQKDIFVKVGVRLSPEVKVAFGSPIVF